MCVKQFGKLLSVCFGNFGILKYNVKVDNSITIITFISRLLKGIL